MNPARFKCNWNKKEEDFLRENINDYNDTELAEMLNRTKGGVTRKRERLHLYRDECYVRKILSRNVRRINSRPKQPPKKKCFSKKYIARRKAREAKEAGILKCQPCIKCGDIYTEMHHPDYNKPLVVVWVCRKHHRELHGRK